MKNTIELADLLIGMAKRMPIDQLAVMAVAASGVCSAMPRMLNKALVLQERAEIGEANTALWESAAEFMEKAMNEYEAAHPEQFA